MLMSNEFFQFLKFPAFPLPYQEPNMSCRPIAEPNVPYDESDISRAAAQWGKKPAVPLISYSQALVFVTITCQRDVSNEKVRSS